MWPAYLGYIGVAAGYLALRTAVPGRVFHAAISFIENPLAFEPVLAQKALALSLVARYGGLLLWPSRLSVDYSYRSLPLGQGWTSPDVICGAVALICAAALAVRCRLRYPAATLGALLGLATYSFTANLIFPIQTMMTERFLTIPAAGWTMFWAGLADAHVMDMSVGRRRLVVAAAAMILVLCAGRTALRNRDWKDSATLFESALAVVPTSAKVNYGLGYLYSESDAPADLARAEVAYARAVTIWSGFGAPWSNRALVLSMLGRHEAAVQSARRATEVESGDVLNWNNLGYVLYQAGRLDEAAVAFRTAVAMNPHFEAARKNLEELDRKMPASAVH